MTCAELLDLLLAYEADELGPAQREFVALHLDRCPACRSAHADLALTRRQLATLRDERWQPQLGPRIGQAIARQHKARRALRWAGWGARLAGLTAALLLVTVSLTQILPGTPSGSQANRVAYVVGPGDRLLRVDTASRRVETVAELDPQATMVEGGGDRFLLNYGFIDRFSPATGKLERLAAAQGSQLLAAAPDGSGVWLVHQEDYYTFRLDLVDGQSGGLSRDPSPKPGYVNSGSVSPDGRHLYLLATVQQIPYLKVVDAATREVIRAYMLPDVTLFGFPPGPRVLESPDGKHLWVAGYGWLVIIERESESAARVIEVPGLTTAAVLSPDGATIITAKNGGGLLEIDPASGRVLRDLPGEIYRSLTWSEDGRWLYPATGSSLEVRHPDSLTRVGRPIPLR